MPADATLVLEIRTYRIKAGMRDAFRRLVADESIPLVRAHGMRVVQFGPSLHDADSYVLMRAFASLEQRTEQEESFYGSDLWLQNYDARVMAMIDSYLTIVIPVSEATIASFAAQAHLW
ncbi:MAG: NIPSNAP family protein [Thermomicrobiales bacterium]